MTAQATSKKREVPREPLSVLYPPGHARNKLIIDVSGRHIHLSKKDAFTLFGVDEIPEDKPLAITGQYVSGWTVCIELPDSTTWNLRVVGPTRNESQIELDRNEYAQAFSIHINECPEPTLSGKLDEAQKLRVTGPTGASVEVACIIPKMHVHVTNSELDGATIIALSPSGVPFYLTAKYSETTDGHDHAHITPAELHQWNRPPLWESWLQFVSGTTLLPLRVATGLQEAYLETFLSAQH